MQVEVTYGPIPEQMPPTINFNWVADQSVRKGDLITITVKTEDIKKIFRDFGYEVKSK